LQTTTPEGDSYPPSNGVDREGNKKVTSKLRGRNFLLMTTGIGVIASHMIAFALARTNHKIATDF
jgi:hypothetical protein